MFSGYDVPQKKNIPVAQGPVRNVVGTTSGAQWRNTALALGMGIACAARRRVQRVQRNATDLCGPSRHHGTPQNKQYYIWKKHVNILSCIDDTHDVT